MKYKRFLSVFIPTAMKIFMRNSMWQIKNHKKYNMKKTFLLMHFLFLLGGVKAQQANTKNTDVIEHREGNSPELKKQQQKVKNETQAVPKPLDSARSAAKMKPATGSQNIPRPVDSIRFRSVVPDRTKTSNKRVDSLTKFIKG